jgi:hypothetical protein
MPTLNWIGKDKVVNHHQDVPCRVLEHKYGFSADGTFIAVNALKTIFSAYDSVKPKAVIWLVPWSNLLEQTVNALSSPEHPYRQKLNALLNHFS